jgi:hypothetical protein
VILAAAGCAGSACVGLCWLGPAQDLGDRPSEHHATVGVDRDGRAVVAYYGDEHVGGARLDLRSGAVEDLELDGPGPVTHPQVRVWDGGTLVLSTRVGAGLVGRALDDPEPLLFDVGRALLPDLALVGDDGLAVWTDYVDLACATFAGPLADLAETTCPAHLAVGGRVGTATVRRDPDRTGFAWTELLPDGRFAVGVAEDDGPAEEVADGFGVDGVAGRPALALLPAGRLAIAWRGGDDPDGPVYARWTVLEGARPIRTAEVLGDAPGDRPFLAGPVDGALVVAWENDDRLWIGLRDAVSGDPLGDDVLVDPDPDRAARRPNLDLGRVGEQVLGLVSWESAPLGSEVEVEDRQVRVRRFEVRHR